MIINSLEKRITKCTKCDRLVKFREKIALEKRKSFSSWEYWGKPVPGYGSSTAKLMILGLAPAAHGVIVQVGCSQAINLQNFFLNVCIMLVCLINLTQIIEMTV